MVREFTLGLTVQLTRVTLIKTKIFGKGKYTWSDGSTYTGDVVRGVRHGTGTMQLSVIPVVYEGQWEDGKRNGQGVIYYDENKSSKYAGGWSKGRRSGKGIFNL